MTQTNTNKKIVPEFLTMYQRPAGLEFLGDDPASDYRAFYGRGEKKFAVYPAGWNFPKNGKPPVLGVVYADNAFLAARRACDLGFSHNRSMLPEVECIGNVIKN